MREFVLDICFWEAYARQNPLWNVDDGSNDDVDLFSSLVEVEVFLIFWILTASKELLGHMVASGSLPNRMLICEGLFELGEVLLEIVIWTEFLREHSERVSH